jgi:hypothetical protein
MNRLVYSNIAINALNSAKFQKTQLLSLDEQLSHIQTQIMLYRVKQVDMNTIVYEQMREQNIKNSRMMIINTIANDIYKSINNAINAIKISIQQNNSTMIILDDYMLQNIANFVNEYYKSNELQLAIKNICNTTMIKYDIATLIINYKQRFLPGLINLNNVLS